MNNSKELINNYFSNLRADNSKIDSFFSYLDNNKIHYAILGGSIRDALNGNLIPRDIDVIFKSENSGIESFFKQNNVSYKLNTFNGMKFSLNKIQFDVWDIKNHFAFKESFYKPQFENICKTTLLNYDSIMFDFTEQILYSKEYYSCINKKLIKLIGKKKLIENNPNYELSICKILELSKIEKFTLSKQIEKYIQEFCKGKSQKTIYLALQESYENHYQKKMTKSLANYIKRYIKTL